MSRFKQFIELLSCPQSLVSSVADWMSRSEDFLVFTPLWGCKCGFSRVRNWDFSNISEWLKGESDFLATFSVKTPQIYMSFSSFLVLGGSLDSLDTRPSKLIQVPNLMKSTFFSKNVPKKSVPHPGYRLCAHWTWLSFNSFLSLHSIVIVKLRIK